MEFSESIAIFAAYLIFGAAVLAYITHLVQGREWVGRGATMLSVLGLLVLALGIALRTVRSGHWPFANLYEFSLLFVGGIVLVHLMLEFATHSRAWGAFILPIAFAIATYGCMLAPAADKVVRPLVPALQSIWFPLHVAAAMVAYGAFAASCAAGLMYLVWERQPRFIARFPSPQRIDQFNFRAVAIGLPWMTLVLLTGAIWAQLAWSRYWSWDIKETWALIIWLVYLFFLHARVLRGWRGRPIAILSVLAFSVVLFTLYGVGQLARWVGLESLHVF
jgi:cytochrome c-type biogenesis protein CcsB